jgi:polyphosphate kinase 2 (PPK2 family)
MSDEEQLRRFRERVITSTKHWKMTAEDIRNRARRGEYLAALDDMFSLTSTAAAPWYVVPAEYKWYTRIAIAVLGLPARHPPGWIPLSSAAH